MRDNLLALKVAYNDPESAGMGKITSGHDFADFGELIPRGLRVRLNGENEDRHIGRIVTDVRLTRSEGDFLRGLGIPVREDGVIPYTRWELIDIRNARALEVAYSDDASHLGRRINDAPAVGYGNSIPWKLKVVLTGTSRIINVGTRFHNLARASNDKVSTHELAVLNRFGIPLTPDKKKILPLKEWSDSAAAASSSAANRLAPAGPAAAPPVSPRRHPPTASAPVAAPVSMVAWAASSSSRRVPGAGAGGSGEYQLRMEAVQQQAGSLAAEQQRMWAAQQAVPGPGRQVSGRDQGFSPVAGAGYPGQAVHSSRQPVEQAVPGASWWPSVPPVPVPAPAGYASVPEGFPVAVYPQPAVGGTRGGAPVPYRSSLAGALVQTPASQPPESQVPASAAVTVLVVPSSTAIAAQAYPVVRADGDELRRWAAENEGSPAFQKRLQEFRIEVVVKASGGIRNDEKHVLDEILGSPNFWQHKFTVDRLREWRNEDGQGLGATMAVSYRQQSQYSGHGQRQVSGPGR